MFLKAHSLLKVLGEEYRSTGDTKKLEALSDVVFLSGYGAIHHVEEEADIESLEDEETLSLAVRAIDAARRLDDLAETLDTGGRDELAEKRRKKSRAAQLVVQSRADVGN